MSTRQGRHGAEPVLERAAGASEALGPRHEVIRPPSDELYSPSPLATPAVRTGGLLFIAGQVGRDMHGKTVEGGIVAQYHQALENIRTVLVAAGADLSHIVRLTHYVTEVESIPDLLEARSAYFPAGAPPSSTVGVVGLARPEWFIEVDAIAAS